MKRPTLATLLALADHCATFGPCSFPTRCRAECRMRLDATATSDAGCIAELLGAREELRLGPMSDTEIGRVLGMERHAVAKVAARGMRRVGARIGRVQMDDWRPHYGHGGAA